MKLVSSFVLLSAVLNASLLVALGSDGVLANPQYGLDDHKYQFEGIDAQNGDEIVEVPCAKGYIVEEDILCDLDDDSCQDDVEVEILKKRETFNNHQHRIDKNIILPRSLSAGHARVTNDAVTQPIFVKRMSAAPPISKEMLNAVMSQKKVHHRRETENESFDGYLVKRRLVDREKTFRLNHPDGIVQKRESGNDDGQNKMVKRMAIGNEMRTRPSIGGRQNKMGKRMALGNELRARPSVGGGHNKMVKRMAIGNEMRKVSGEHWSMPHRRAIIHADAEKQEPLVKRMAVGHENIVVHNGKPLSWTNQL